VKQIPYRRHTYIASDVHKLAARRPGAPQAYGNKSTVCLCLCVCESVGFLASSSARRKNIIQMEDIPMHCGLLSYNQVYRNFGSTKAREKEKNIII